MFGVNLTVRLPGCISCLTHSAGIATPMLGPITRLWIESRWHKLCSEGNVAASYNATIRTHGKCRIALLGRHGIASLCRDGQKDKMAAIYKVLAFKR